MFNDDVYSLIPYNSNGGLINAEMFKEAIRERFINMVQNCKIFYSNGDMYVQVDKTVYRKVSHDILRRFENISYIYLRYAVMEQFPEEIVPSVLLEDTFICDEIKQVVIGMYQLEQYEKMFWIMYANIHPNIELYMDPVTVKVHYGNGEIKFYPHMRMFHEDFFKFDMGDDLDGLIQV